MVAGVVESWSADPSQYQLLGKIGQGAFATVWKARKLSSNTQTTPNQDATSTTTVVSTADGTLATTTTTEQSHHHHHSQSQNFHYCAVKLLNLDAAATTNLADIRGEVQAMRLLSHPNVLTCYTAFVHDRNLWLVTPLMSKGSSLHCLSSARRQRRLRNRRIQQQQQNATAAVATTTVTTENERIPTATAIPMIQHILYILHETLLGLQYIHENGQQIHRDIKAGNILVDGTGGIAIADFGVSSSSSGNSKRSLLLEKAQTFVGTPCWMAPEVMEQVHGYDCKADLWSLGITALELVKGYAPYAKYPPMKVLILTIQEDPPSLASYDVENGGDDEDEDNRNDNLGGTFASTISGFSDAVPTGHDRSMFEALVALCLQKNPLLRPTCSELLASRYFAEYSANPELRALRQAAMRDDICSLVDDVGGEPTAIAMTASTQTASDALSSPLLCTDETTAWRNSPLRNTSGGLVPSTFYDGAPESSSASKSIAWSQSEERPAGTTWVFADGSSSQVLLSSENTGVDGSMDSQEEVDTVLEELDEFERRTGGEHYERNALTEVPTDLPEVGRNLSAAEQPRPSSITPTVIPLAVERLIDDNGRTARNEELPDNDAGGGALDDLDQFMDEFEQTTVGENFRRNSPTEH